ncbi:LOW QUALITY PROTEIN: C-factor-like [Falco cherrug]|uniref:LOW QUALITY PROTEIN: C-factor-like n=1 Tax=Falco cherrug TaxID=345164 RepID=UPI00247B097C|nr:LOW QUALITY PROTEIN: C-factor-like [Falco cherrug]
MAALAQSVLVTGSNCSIRRELVRQLAASPRPPQHIFATCRNPEGPRGKELAAQHPGIKLVQLDAVNLSSIQGAVRAVGSHLEDQGLNLLINNAGISSQATLRSLDSQEMLSMFATNVVGPLQVAKEFLPLLKKAAKGARKGGLSCSRAAVINISSKLGSIGLCLRVPEAPMYAYRASKLRCQGRCWECSSAHSAHGGEPLGAAQNMVTRCMAADFQDKGILCAAIHPGWVKTDMGTEKAPLMVERSMRGILAVLASLSQDTSGAFLDWAGSSLPW